MEIEVKSFTAEQNEDLKKVVSALSTELQNEVKKMLEKVDNNNVVAELKALIEKSASADELKSIKDQFAKLETEIAKKMVTKSQPEVKSLGAAMYDLMNSEEFKLAKKSGFKDNKVFELKASTSDITGAVNLTRQDLSVNFNPERQLAFLPFMNTGQVGQDKNRVLWVEGSYTSNVGYVSEGTGQSTADTGAAVEKSRGLAKISAKLPLTAELLEDADYVASAFRMKMQEKAMQYVDAQVYAGDGNDSTAANHIYGIQGHATAFSASTAGVANAVTAANIGDLVDAMILQAEKSEQRGLNRLWMNPSDFFKFKTAKDNQGQYLFVKDVNGQYSINGLQVVRTNAVTAGTMLVADTSKIQLWWKRNPEIKFSQMNGTDFIDDKYTAVMFLRCQVVVETPDKTALIYVSDIDAAIEAIAAV